MDRLTPEQEQTLKAPAQTMSLESFRSAVEQNLIALIGEEEAAERMKAYGDDFPQFYAENWSVAGITPALIMYGI